MALGFALTGVVGLGLIRMYTGTQICYKMEPGTRYDTLAITQDGFNGAGQKLETVIEGSAKVVEFNQDRFEEQTSFRFDTRIDGEVVDSDFEDLTKIETRTKDGWVLISIRQKPDEEADPFRHPAVKTGPGCFRVGGRPFVFESEDISSTETTKKHGTSKAMGPEQVEVKATLLLRESETRFNLFEGAYDITTRREIMWFHKAYGVFKIDEKSHVKSVSPESETKEENRTSTYLVRNFKRPDPA